MRKRFFCLAHISSILVLALGAHTAMAADNGAALPLDLVKPGALKLDGVLKEWTAPFTPLATRLRGAPHGRADLEARAAFAYDDSNLYVAMDITDDKLVRTHSYAMTEDHAALVLAFPGASGDYQAVEIELFAGDPGNVAGAVRTLGGAAVPNASLVEAPRPGGYTFEAKIPWAAFPAASTTRVGLRGAIRLYDNDGAGSKGVIGTSRESAPGSLPRALTMPEQAIADAFAHEKGLRGDPDVDVVADVAGDAQRERVLLWGRYLLVAGPHFRDGEQFFFSDLGVSRPDLALFEVRDLTGDAKAEVLVRKRISEGTRWHEVLQVLGFTGETLSVLFEHDVGAGGPQGAIEDRVTVTPEPQGARIELRAGEARGGLNAASFGEPPHEGGVLLPWAGAKSASYIWDGTHFAPAKGEATAGTLTVARSSEALRPQPPPPRPPTAEERLDQVLSLYKRDRNLPASAAPSFDLAANVADDERAERVLAFGKDLVVLGPGFLAGTAYRSVALGFENAQDVVDVTTFDLTNDGRAEILVRGVQESRVLKESGIGKREVLLVYTLEGDKVTRVFGCETALASGTKRVEAALGFVPNGAQGYAIALRPGRAQGWSEGTWPFQQDTAPSDTRKPAKAAAGAIEPLVLPWASGNVRYVWQGSVFTKELSCEISARSGLASFSSSRRACAALSAMWARRGCV